MIRKLKLGGILHLATDWEDYAYQMMNVLEAFDGLSKALVMDSSLPVHNTCPMTRVEMRGERRGHGVWDLVFFRT